LGNAEISATFEKNINYMKKIFFIPIAIVTLIGIVNAQNAAPAKPAQAKQAAAAPSAPAKKTVEEKAKAGVASVDKVVTLKGDQAEKLNKVLVDFYTKKEALTAKRTTMGKDEFITAMKDLQSKKNADIKAVLNPDQVKLLDAHMAARAKATGKPVEEK
jgi:hypothetical protein